MTTKSTIPKGFILKARRIEDSDIANASPCTRELWDLILRKANFRDRKCGRTVIKRGQWLTSYEEIQDLLHWRIGFRKLTYSWHQIEAAMKYMRSRSMVTTQKATRGFFITALNYEKYQRLDSYERHSEDHNEDHDNATGQRRNGKKEEELPLPLLDKPPQPQEAKPCAPSDAGLIFDRWNSQAGQSVEKNGQTITWKSHRRRSDGSLPPDITTAIQRCLDAGYSVADICGAIDNYARVLLKPEYFWSYVWPLATFLTVGDGRGSNAILKWTRFAPDNFTPETYLLNRRQNDAEQDIGKLAGCEPADENDARELYQESGLIEE